MTVFSGMIWKTMNYECKKKKSVAMKTKLKVRNPC